MQQADDKEFLTGLLTFARGVTFFTSMCGTTACLLSYAYSGGVQTILYATGTTILISASLTTSRLLHKVRAG